MLNKMYITNFYNYVYLTIIKNKKLIILSLIIYLSSFIAGTLVFFTVEPIDQMIDHSAHPTSSSLLQEIMVNNLIIIILMILGSFLLGIPTIVSLMSNGFLLGALIAGALRCGSSILNILTITVPHCLFELPAVWIAGAVSFKIAYEFLRYFRKRKNYILNNEEIGEFLILSGIALLLIIIAAFIEVYVTYRLFRLLYLDV